MNIVKQSWEWISKPPDILSVIELAGRVCYKSEEKITETSSHEFIRKLIGRKHDSVLEHATISIRLITNRGVSHELVRHRLASYTQQSQRYVSLKKLDYVTPFTISTHQQIRAKYDEAVQAAHQLYGEMLEAGIPAEDARYVLPQAIETQLVMTMNARELMHACSLRLCDRAQWEIRELFERIKTEVEKVAPFIGAELKPKCYDLGYCNERESCGLFPTLKGSEITLNKKERGLKCQQK